jgi:hypothetical protein
MAGVRGTLRVLIASTILAIAADARAQEAVAEHDELVRERRTLMIALAAWGGASVATGALLLATDPVPGATTPERRSFQRGLGAMSLLYGAINLGLAAGTLVSLSQSERPPTREAIFGGRRASADVFAANAALDVLYVGVGGALWQHGEAPAARGTGAGMVVQGSFLVLFDTVGAAILRH